MIKIQTYWHVDAKTFPEDIQKVITTLCYELDIPNRSGSVMRWIVSSKQFEVCPPYVDFDNAANAFNHYLTKVSAPTFDGGTTLYIDL